MRNRIKIVGAVIGCGLAYMALYAWYSGPACAAGKAPLQPDALAAQIAEEFEQAMPKLHLTHHKVDASVATNALQIYLSALDYDHSYFLASDVEEFRKDAPQLPERMATGDVSFAFKVFERYRSRVADRVACAEQLLKKGFDLTTNESFQWKRKDAPWPADEQEWNELWRKKVQNEYVARMVAMRLAEEDKTNAVKTAGAATNQPPAGTNMPPAGTNQPGTNGVKGAVVRDADLTPEAFLLKRHKQYLNVLEDSDADFVLQRFFTAFAEAYDPHSEYMTAGSTEDFDITMKLSLVGVGALLGTEDGAARVESIIVGGPADRDGRLKAGDKIIAVGQGDQEPVEIMHWPLSKTVRLIRGEKGTKVTLTVIPASGISGSVTEQIALIRDEVKLEEQAAKGKVLDVFGESGRTNKIGVITLPAFYADMRNKMNSRGGQEFKSSTRDVVRIIQDMQAKGAQGLVLDLRNNGGGSLAEAVEMTGLFLKAGPVVQVRDRRVIQVLSDPDPDALYAGPLMVLVNRQSASASEILAAALQDYGRALLVGDSKTHGKGTVQSLQTLDERNARLGSLKVTTHSFHRIAGGSTQLKGVTPDIVIPSVLDALDIGEEFLPNAMPWTVVPGAGYRPVADLQPLIPVLRKKSEARREHDPRFGAQRKLLDELAARQKSSAITLNLAERLKLAHAEKALEEVQNDALDMDAGGLRPKDQKGPDVVLDEATRILADLIALSGRER